MQIKLSTEMDVGCTHQPRQKWDIQQRIIYPHGTKLSVVCSKIEGWNTQQYLWLWGFFFIGFMLHVVYFWGLLCLKANFSTLLCWLTEAFRTCLWTFTLLCFVIFCSQSTVPIWHNTVLCAMILTAELAEDNTVLGLPFFLLCLA